jgi:hypothetical protein
MRSWNMTFSRENGMSGEKITIHGADKAKIVTDQPVEISTDSPAKVTVGETPKVEKVEKVTVTRTTTVERD